MTAAPPLPRRVPGPRPLTQLPPQRPPAPQRPPVLTAGEPVHRTRRAGLILLLSAGLLALLAALVWWIAAAPGSRPGRAEQEHTVGVAAREAVFAGMAGCYGT